VEFIVKHVHHMELVAMDAFLKIKVKKEKANGVVK
jgi:hypothetical protein